MCASIVKWTIHDPFLGSSKSDSKLYTNFDTLWRNSSQTFENHIDLQSQAINDDENNFKKSLHILEDGASGVQVGDIEQVIVINLFRIWKNYIKLMVFYGDDDRKYIMISRNMKEKFPISKNLRSWNLCSKSNSTMCFWASLLMIRFEGLNMIFHIWVCNTKIEIIMKINQI